MRTPSRRACAEVENAEGVFQGAWAGFCIGQSGCESTQSKSRARLRLGAPTGCSRYMSDLWIADIAAWLPVEPHCQSQSLFGALCLKTLSRIAEVFSLCNQGLDFGTWGLLFRGNPWGHDKGSSRFVESHISTQKNASRYGARRIQGTSATKAIFRQQPNSPIQRPVPRGWNRQIGPLKSWKAKNASHFPTAPATTARC